MPARPVDRCQRPWNKGLLVGQKKPLEPKHVWSIRVRLEVALSMRDLAIFNLAIDSKLCACDLVKLRTKAAQIYRKTGNLRAVHLLLGHTKLESTVRYLGIEVDDALNMAEQIEL
jgi:hypothetical protein